RIVRRPTSACRDCTRAGEQSIDHFGRRTNRQPRFKDRRRNYGVARGSLSARPHHHFGYARARHCHACTSHHSFAGRRGRKRRTNFCPAIGNGRRQLRSTVKRFVYELEESWRIAYAQMRSNLTRSTLTALGVIIGIVAVTLMGTAIGGISVGFDKSMAVL